MIIVNCGPLTLSTVSGLVTETPPGYTPLVTRTTSFAAATFRASWILVAAVTQLA